MPRLAAIDKSGNGPSALVPSTDQDRDILIFNSALGETGATFWARDFPQASVYIIDIDVGAGDTVVIETRSDATAAWAIEQTVTVDGAFQIEVTEQFRIRRTVAASASKAWLTTRRH